VQRDIRTVLHLGEFYWGSDEARLVPRHFLALLAASKCGADGWACVGMRTCTHAHRQTRMRTRTHARSVRHSVFFSVLPLSVCLSARASSVWDTASGLACLIGLPMCTPVNQPACVKHLRQFAAVHPKKKRGMAWFLKRFKNSM
jgi:hypothetical protein